MKITNDLELLAASDELVFVDKTRSKTIKIEPKQTELLELLAKNKNEVCSSDYIIQNIWPGQDGVGREALRKNIYKLRQVLKSIGYKNILLTIPKKGYKLSDLMKKPFGFRSYNFFWAALIILSIYILFRIIIFIYHHVL